MIRRPAHRRSALPITRTIVTATVVTLIAATALSTAHPSPAGAETRSSSRVSGRGDILTTILFNRTTRRVQKGVTTGPVCRTVKYDDFDIEGLIAATSWGTDSVVAQRYAPLISQYLSGDDSNGPTSTEYDLVARSCGRTIEDVWVEPRPEATTLAQRISRTMITRLPAPIIHQSPPAGSAVPVGEPVFLAVDPQNWTPVHAQLQFAAVTASVRATPVSIRVFSGEPETPFITCTGPGRRFDAALRVGARIQTRLEGTCTFSYDSAHQPGIHPVPRLGSMSILWRTEWRTGDGPWRSLGLIPRTVAFERTVVELGSPIIRTFAPIPSTRR